MIKLTAAAKGISLAPKEKSIYMFVENHPGCQSGEIAEKLNIPLGTVKRILAYLVNEKQIIKHGSGPGTNVILPPNRSCLHPIVWDQVENLGASVKRSCFAGLKK